GGSGRQGQHGRDGLSILPGHDRPGPKGEGRRGDARGEGRERAGGREPPVRALLRALPAIIRTIRGLATDPVLPKATKIALAAAVLYVVSPVDLVPDFIPVLGYLDDLIIAAIIVDGILNFVDRGVVLKYWPGSPELLERVARSARVLAAWVPERLKIRIFSPR